MGQLVHAKLENEQVPEELIFGPVNLLMKALNGDFYSNARRMPIDKFWKAFLNQHWHLVQDNRTEQDNLQDMIQILTSIFYHKPQVLETPDALESADE